MLVLAIACANFSTSLALVNKNQILADFKNVSTYHESATLIPRIEDLFKKSDRSLAQLESIIVTTGPGSFTGIRLGIAAAQGLSYALNIPFYAVNSFNWVAHSYKKYFGLSTDVLVALESKREEIFVTLYSKDLVCQRTPDFLTPKEVIASLELNSFDVIGDAALYFSCAEKEIKNWMPDALDLAHYMFTYQSFPEKFDDCRPYYIRAPEIHGHS